MFFPLFDDSEIQVAQTEIPSDGRIPPDDKNQVLQSLHHDRGTHSIENYKKIKCTQCRKRFDTEDQMFAHRERHVIESTFGCGVCPKKFTSHSSLWKHIKSHSGERPFICEICKKGFTQLANLQRHHFVHNGLKPYQCPICQKSFSQHANMIKHQLLHTGEKPFKCKVCDKSFAQRANLKKHEFIHSGIKKFSCSICFRSYAQSGNLKKHLLVHEKEQNQARDFVFVYQCTYCHTVVNKSTQNDEHIRTCNKAMALSAINCCSVQHHGHGRHHVGGVVSVGGGIKQEKHTEVKKEQPEPHETDESNLSNGDITGKLFKS